MFYKLYTLFTTLYLRNQFNLSKNTISNTFCSICIIMYNTFRKNILYIRTIKVAFGQLRIRLFIGTI